MHLTLGSFATVFFVGPIQGEWQRHNRGRMEPIRKTAVKEVYLTQTYFVTKKIPPPSTNTFYHFTSRFTFYVHHTFNKIPVILTHNWAARDMDLFLIWRHKLFCIAYFQPRSQALSPLLLVGRKTPVAASQLWVVKKSFGREGWQSILIVADTIFEGFKTSSSR